jgi:hypothetical protein
MQKTNVDFEIPSGFFTTEEFTNLINDKININLEIPSGCYTKEELTNLINDKIKIFLCKNTISFYIKNYLNNIL